MGTLDNKRLHSLDALRGFTMFWIIGGDALFHALAKATNWSFFTIISDQLKHVPWDGFHFYDLIFPMFMFVSGVAFPFALGKKLDKGVPRFTIWKGVAKRALLLVLFGILYNNAFSFDFANLRYASVLGQIGVAYLIAATIYLYTKSVKAQIAWIIGILLAFWAAMALVPVPGFGPGVLTPEGNLSGYLDRLLLPGKTYTTYYDPQGIILMISATTITLSGGLVGRLITNKNLNDTQKCRNMIIIGAILIGVALLWNVVYPINKEIWSSPFNVLTVGISMILFTLFYFIIDVKGWQKWSFPLVVIGMNSITIYMATRIIDFWHTSDFFLTGLMSMSGNFAPVFLAAGVIAAEWLFLYFLYKKNIFLRV